MSLSVLVFKNL